MKSNLNAKQLEAVNAIKGPVLVFAGAGTGKTRTLTERIINMIENHDIAPSEILAITFTKKATNEMRNRLVLSLKEKAEKINISTIHSLCAKILRKSIYRLGYNANFEILDDEDALKMINDIYKNINLDKKVISPKAALNAIGRYKNDMGELFGETKRVYDEYQKILKEENLLDFDDLLVHTKQLFEENEDILAYFQDKYKYILVDEFQDVNRIQYAIIKLLAEKNQNIFVVGDDDQSIYSFRGADVNNMLNFANDFSNPKIIKLTENYRSSQAILNGANNVICNNHKREEKALTSLREGDLKDVIINETYYFEDEARYVANEIHTLHNHGYAYKDIAVLYRSNVMSRNFEISMIENKIPYVVYGGFSYLKRREVKDIISYLKFILDHDNFIHFKRIINQPTRGIGDKTIAKIKDYMDENNVKLFEAIDVVNEITPSSKTNALIEFKNMIIDLTNRIDQLSFEDFFDEMLDKTGYLAMIKAEDEVEKNREANIKEFKSILFEIENSYRDENLSQSDILRLGFDELILDETIGVEDKDDAVRLSTVHSVKGLEFKVVFVTALEEGIFPILRDETDIEEERRIAYVAFTRAIDKIYLTCSSRRLIYGRIVKNQKSRFFNEYVSSRELANYVEEINSMKKAMPGEIKVGNHVYHSNFGEGLVITVDDNTIQVLFSKDNSLRKLLKDHPAISKI